MKKSRSNVKKILAVALALVTMLALAVPAFAAGYIGEDRAKEIAYNHAGVSASAVVYVTVERDYENGKMIYDVEFYAKGMEYDYEIDATTGAVISYDHESDRITVPGGTSVSITEAKAKEIALKDAGISASNARYVKVKLDYDDGVAVWEIEFISGNTEYDYEINASNGNIMSRGTEPVSSIISGGGFSIINWFVSIINAIIALFSR